MTTTLATVYPFTTKTDDRRITRSWLVEGTQSTDKYGDDWQARLDMTIKHNKDAKRYEVRFNRVQVSAKIVSWTMGVGGDEDKQPVTDYVAEAAPRYSAKRLNEIADESLARLSQSQLEALIEWAGRAKQR